MGLVPDSSLDACEICGEPVESPLGTLDLNEDGECEDCALDRDDYVEGMREDHMRDVACGWDFDYSMNG